jgi:YjbR protein
MKPDQFRRIALGMQDAIEGAHMGHPDFRTSNKIFATLHPDGKRGMVKLTPDQQREFMTNDPSFVPASGAWGRQGCTMVELRSVNEATLGEAMTLAWQNAVRERAATRAKKKPAPTSARERSRRAPRTT